MRTQVMARPSQRAVHTMHGAMPGWAGDHRSGSGLDQGPSIRPALSALTDPAASPPQGAVVQRGKKAKKAAKKAPSVAPVIKKAPKKPVSSTTQINLAHELLGTGDVSRAGLHKHIKKLSKKKVRESEHMLPMAVTSKAFPGAKADDEPTHSIDYTMHRAGQSGAGGGITSTGSSGTAKGWADHLLSLHKSGQTQEMYRQVALDTYHSAQATGQDLDQTMVQIQGVLNEHATKGRLDNDGVGQIMNGLMDHHYSERERLGQL